MLVAVVFPEVVVIVPGVASVSGLFVAVSWGNCCAKSSWAISHQRRAFSLSFSFSFSRLLVSDLILLLLFRCHACSLSLYCLLVLSLRFPSVFCNKFVIIGLRRIITGFVVVVVVVVRFSCTYGVLVRMPTFFFCCCFLLFQ